jgi:hypothetical protein
MPKHARKRRYIQSEIIKQQAVEIPKLAQCTRNL